MTREELRTLLLDGGFARLGETDRDGVYAVDLDGLFIDANAAFYARTGLTWDELGSVSFGSSLHEEYKQVALDSFFAARNGEVRTWRGVATLPGGVIETVTINMPFFHDGECIAVLGIVRDIGAVEQNEQRAKALEATLTEILGSMTDGIFFVNRDWLFTYANERAVEMSRRALDDLLGASLWDMFPYLQSSEIGDAYRRAMSTGTRAEFQGFSPGLGRWVVITANPTSDGLAVYVRDIGDEVEARAKLHNSEKRTLTQAALLDAARDAMIVRNLDGSIAYWNRAATSLYGWTSAEAVGSPARELLYDDPGEYDRALDAVFADGYWYGSLHQRTSDGTRVTVESRWTLVRTPDGDPDSIFDVSTDVTQQLATEQHHLRAQRLESLGRLAGGIAHDLNNVLTPILLSAQILAELHDDPAVEELSRGIERAALRGADLIKQVLSFARGEDGRRERIDMTALVVEIERFCRETLPKNIAVSVHSEPGLPDVLGDATQLMQVLVNVVVNARDAMPDGGPLRISASSTTSGGRDELATVVIEVADSGIGMTADVMDTIFEPFFTTKAFGSGTGLGLATSLSIAQRHGGVLAATSEPGVGSILRLELPALPTDEHDDAETSSADRVPVSPRVGAGQLILVVDDEPDIRQVNCRTLEAAGYRTVSASNGEEGLAAFGEHAREIRLVLTDLMMPVLDGAGMIEQLRAHGFDGPVLATSGGSHAPDGLRDRPSIAFLGKPYGAHELAATIHELIGEATY